MLWHHMGDLLFKRSTTLRINLQGKQKLPGEILHLKSSVWAGIVPSQTVPPFLPLPKAMVVSFPTAPSTKSLCINDWTRFPPIHL